MRQSVTCGECSKFTPCPFGEPNAIGKCKEFADYCAKLGRPIRATEYDKAMLALGKRVFRPKIDRYCSKFSRKQH